VGGVVGAVAIIGICVFIWHQKRTKKLREARKQRQSEYPMDNAQYYAQEAEKRAQFAHMEQLPEEFPEDFPEEHPGAQGMPSRFAEERY
jgi:FtsZ-interacting cell division protein ZipA